MKNSIKILSPFGPKIAKLKLPRKIIHLINEEVDNIISNKKISKIFYD
jgi:hypothetical protein